MLQTSKASRLLHYHIEKKNHIFELGFVWFIFLKILTSFWCFLKHCFCFLNLVFSIIEKPYGILS